MRRRQSIFVVLLSLLVLAAPNTGVLAQTPTYADPRLQRAVDWAIAQSRNPAVKYAWGSGSATECERFIENAFGTTGKYWTASDPARNGAFWDMQDRGLQLDPSQTGLVQPGVIIYFEANEGNGNAGHAGIYIGDGQMVSVGASGVTQSSVDDWNSSVAALLGYMAPPEDWAGLPSPTPAPVIQATPIPATPTSFGPTVLFRADWSGGLNGWTGDPTWRSVGGMAVNDGTQPSNGSLLLAPYRAQSPDYSIEATIQSITNQYGFAIVSRYESGNGYRSSINVGDGTAYFEPLAGGYSPFSQVIRFSPAGDWHSYRVDVHGNHYRLLADGVLLTDATDNRFLSGNQVGLWAFKNQVNVRSYSILAP
jgi:hypothetical protein